MRIATALSFIVMTAAACTVDRPTPGAAQQTIGDRELPARMIDAVPLGADRSGDLRPEAHAILDALESHDGPLTVGDLREVTTAEGHTVLPADAAFAWNPPQTIRVWRRGIDGSSTSCSGRVDEIPFDQYVKGVLPHEWIASWHDESLKTGAVVIRTYAAAWVNAGGKYDCADLDDTTASQVYEDEFLPQTDAAVDATAGIYVVDGDELVFAEYSAENSDPTEFGVSEPHCTGLEVYGHGRGTCQWGSQRWANDGKTFDWIATHYYPGSELVGIESVHDASYVGESYELDMVAGEEVVAWLEYENTGNTTWSLTETLVGTTQPADRESPFFVEGNWASPSRPTGADHSDYTPGTVGRFTWLMQAPEVEEQTTFEESFALVTGDGEWFGDEVTWTITVHPAGTCLPGADDPDGTDDGNDDDGSDEVDGEPGPAGMSAGCSSAGAAPGGLASALLVVLLLVPVLRRRRGPALAALSTAILVAVGACASPGGPEPVERDDNALGGDSELVDLFLEAEADHGVPAEILATVSYVETRLRFVGVYDDGTAENGHSHAGAIGLMALTEGGPRDLVLAAELAGVAEAEAHTEPHANVMAAAALMADRAASLPNPPVELSEWRPVLVDYAGGSEAFAREVYRRIDQGWRARDARGAMIVHSARPIRSVEDGFGHLSQGLGYPGANWDPAHYSNYTDANRGAGDINYIVIHTVQGSYAGAISWFKNSSANVAAHYVTRSSDGAITQMVDDRDIGWHVACFNDETIGIEHEGYVDEPDVWYTEQMYLESAKLTAWLADQYGIPKDRDHIMGHGEAPDCSSHTDPGSGWDWDHYMELVQSGGAPSYEAAYVGQDTPEQLVAGEERVVWFEFSNGSNVTWDLNQTRLGTAEPRDRQSPFYVDGNWFNPHRPTGADHSNYAPGDTGRFTFLIRAPEVSEPTEFTEAYQLVQEGEAWFGPVVTMTVTVVPEGWDGGDGDGGDGDGGDDGDSGGGNGDGIVDGVDGAHAGGQDGPGTMSGGCRVGGGAGSAGYAILLLSAMFVCRRRRSRG